MNDLERKEVKKQCDDAIKQVQTIRNQLVAM